MTSLTSMELKMIFFGLIFMSLVGIIGALYQSDPIPAQQVYAGPTGATNKTTTSSDSWIDSFFGVLPKPLDDPMTGIAVSAFITPVAIMLAYIAVRAVKDLLTQWI